MKPVVSLLLISSLFFFECCKGSKYAATELPELQLKFGNGGGFTGAETEYVLLKNGQTFKKNSLNGEVAELPKVKRKLVKNLFKEAETLKLDSLDINDPGNIYKFIEFKVPGMESKRITWGRPDTPVNEKIDSLYSALNELVNKLHSE